MNANNGHLDKDAHVQLTPPEWAKPGQVLASPLGWSIKGRLICVAAAIALLWLSVAWAIGWL
jgi:hypothetical protein